MKPPSPPRKPPPLPPRARQAVRPARPAGIPAPGLVPPAGAGPDLEAPPLGVPLPVPSLSGGAPAAAPPTLQRPATLQGLAPPPPPPAPRVSVPTPQVSVPPMRPRLPSAGEETMSTQAKLSLADIAMQLRDEQIQARIIHYKQELETSPELDAVTAQVVSELYALKRAAGVREASVAPPPPKARDELEIELIQSFKLMLSRLFRADKVSSLVERKMAEVTKRFARLFFESELHDKIRGSSTETKTMRFVEQATYHVLARYEAQLMRELDTFEYVSPDIHTAAREQLQDLVKEYRNQFLSRTTPELNVLVKLINEVFVQFFTQELPPVVGELAWEVVKESRVADAPGGQGYKISVEGFPRFRHAFERRFLQRLVNFATDEVVRRVREREDRFRKETIRFVSDPQIFTDVCELVCDAVYDFLYNDGFLDLPPDWRVRLARS